MRGRASPNSGVPETRARGQSPASRGRRVLQVWTTSYSLSRANIGSMFETLRATLARSKPLLHPITAEKTRCWRSSSRYIGYEKEILRSNWEQEARDTSAVMRAFSQRTGETSTRRSGSRTDTSRSSSALMSVNIAVFAPIPSPRERTATAVKPGLLRRTRMA